MPSNPINSFILSVHAKAIFFIIFFYKNIIRKKILFKFHPVIQRIYFFKIFQKIFFI